MKVDAHKFAKATESPIAFSEEIMEKIGLSAKIIAGIGLGILAVMILKNYFDIKKTRLEIAKLEKEGN